MKHNSPERFEAYKEQFFKGLLDVDMRPHAVCMDPDYTPDTLRFARRPEREEQASKQWHLVGGHTKSHCCSEHRAWNTNCFRG